ncbi:hypothetical protein, partial [Burkholderia sp. SIMBA_024]|uniref:hypothetical protein n=1 Tax=Burkholderia sp. SIMBA_024 TaxID=3085768 RepID=UPI003978D3CA
KESDPASEDIDPLITGGTDLLIAWAGPNDVATGGDNLNAAAAYERVKTYVGNRQAAGWRVYVCTSPHTGAATQNARLGQLATLIRDDAEGLG